MNNFINDFVQDFIVDDRWKFIVKGLGVTLEVTALALIFGTIIGLIIGIIRCAHDQQSSNERRGACGAVLSFLNMICRIYVTVIRGTPVLVQLLIMYFIILVSAKSKVVVAVATFSINSGAYVAEIFRGGIMSIDKGQMEAGRSLGLNYVQTMRYTIIPQAMKACLPALANEMIALLKETSICGYIGLNELTRGGDIIRGTTFDALLPLFAVALIYLTFVMVLSYLISLFERRLRKSDNR
ncbi:polar amino acid transport system permease protein [Lachnospiraceae bacterium XBB2008]|nr:polar amino acid transport system permease protein [Lachnospiraceae bacterium XBB2008]